MKKTAIASVALAAALFAVSCQKEATLEQRTSGPMTISAVAEGLGTPTKTELAFKYDVLWSSTDKIYVVDGQGNHDTFSLHGGEGTTKGTFKQDDKTKFTGEVQAYYPATMLLGGSPVWPASQTNDQTIPMYCKKTLSGAAEERMDFASLGSVLQIVFNTTQENVTLKFIEIKDGSATLSGAFTVDTDGKAVITATDKAGITLDLGTGVALGKAANYFNIAVPAGNYQDLTLVFTATDGRKCTMTKGKVNIAYNAVGRLTLMGEKFKAVALPGEFSVSATKKVHFSKGNLTYNVTSTTWAFYEHQYDCATDYDSDLISLFTWGYDATKSIVPNGQASDNVSRTSGNLEQTEDWGCTIGDGNTWRTLSTEEWQYLFNKDNTYGVNNRSGKYQYGVTVCGKENCVVLLPDNWEWDETADEHNVGTGWQDGGYPETQTGNEVTWKKMENAGAVCLPAAGRRVCSTVSYVDGSGHYWSSTAIGDGYAYDVYFNSSKVDPGNSGSGYRDSGYSVRLVTDASVTPAPTPTTTGTAKATIGGSEVDVNWVQLWENGPKFAEYNVGVTDGKAESYGGYYAWGGSQDKVDDHDTGDNVLSGDNDTATKLWGSNWRMPTKAELEALLSNCNVVWTTVGGVNGRKFTGKGAYASNSVFLPAAGNCLLYGDVGAQGDIGFYWSSTPSGSDYAYLLYFDSDSQFESDYYSGYGYSVRAVLAE